MTAEQQGVSPATAGGALSPGQIRAIREAQAEANRKIIAAINGTFIEQPDPRDAEIKQLRTALARYQKRLGDDLLCGGKLVERARAALRVDDGSTCIRASMDGVAGDVGRLCDEIERLRADVLVVQQHLQRAHGQPDSCVTTEYMGPDFSRAMVDGLRDGKEKAEASLAVEQRNLLNEMDEHQTAQALLADAREEWKRADAEVTRLKQLVGNENVDPNWDCVDRAEAIRQANEFHADRIKWMGEHEKRVNEVGRLYGRLDNQRAEVERANADTIRAIKDRDAAEAERDRLRQQLDQHLADENSAQAANDRLRNELTRERAIYADSPDDRVYHAADNTWWRRAVLLGRIRDILREADAKPAEPRIAEDRCGAGNEDYPELRCKLAAGHQNDHEDPDQGAGWSPEIATPAEPRRWHVGDPEPEIGTTVWRRAEKYTRSSNGWHRVDIHTGYASWAWILSVGSEVVESVSTDG